jgi:FkbM family methyltransferase
MNAVVREVVRSFLPRNLKAHRIRRGPLAGNRIFTSWHDYPGAISGGTERPLLSWFARHINAGETWIDIGAHYGYTAIALSLLVGRGGRVIAFEPVSATASCIARTRDLNDLQQLRIVPLGLASSPGIRPVYLPVTRGMADSTLRGATNGGEVIFVSSFDHLWDTLAAGDPSVDGIKIDVQGMEHAVLAGMKSTLLRCHPKLVIEFHPGVNRGQILNFLADCGYSPLPVPIEPCGRPGQIADNCSYAFSPRPHLSAEPC